MRTTLSLDDDVLRAAKDIARARGVSLGTVVSQLMRESLTAPNRGAAQGRAGYDAAEAAGHSGADEHADAPDHNFVVNNGIHAFPAEGAGQATRELVQHLMDREDEDAIQFARGVDVHSPEYRAMQAQRDLVLAVKPQAGPDNKTGKAKLNQRGS